MPRPPYSHRHLRPATRALAVVAAFTVASGGCDAPAEPPPPPAAELPERPSELAVGVEREDLLREADGRLVGEALRAGLAASDPTVRRLAALGIGRIRSPIGLNLLRRALRDTDPTVRRAASLGVGGLGASAPARAVPLLTGALAAETDPRTEAALIRDLGRIGSDDALTVVTPLLRADSSSARQAACLALGERGLAGHDVPAPLRARLAALLGSSEPAEVRLACAYALARLPVQTDAQSAQGVVVALGVAVADPDPDVRAYAYRALGRHAGSDLTTLAHGTADQDWRVAVQAFGALAARAATEEGGARPLARALRGAHERAVDDGGPRAGPELQVLLAALDAARPLARSTPVFDLANELYRALGSPPEAQPTTRARGLAHCAAAELADQGRGWPSRVESCGLEQVLPEERAVLEARVLGSLDGAEAQRLARLRRLFEREEPAVRAAVMAAAARILHPDATSLVLEGLEVDDPGVVASAADALIAIAQRRPGPDVAPPPLPAEQVLAALRTARAHIETDQLETLQSWLGAVEAAGARVLLQDVRDLGAHPNQAVRSRARRVLAALDETPPELEPIESAHPVPVSALPAADARPRVRLQTDRGEMILELRADQAPTTVARFLQLVEAGFYDGLSFHRVVPGFVVQGGDPRGDGYGGPDFWQRCEDNRLPYRRGTVGMALAGRDTGGSQFFITHGAQPHLEMRYTAFAQVVEGLDVLDRLLPGDRIRAATVP